MGKSSPGTKKIRTVWLDADGDSEMYFCSRCRIPLIEVDGTIIQEVPGRPPYKPYTTLKCKGSVQRKDGVWEECGRYYCFVATVYTKNPQPTK